MISETAKNGVKAFDSDNDLFLVKRKILKSGLLHIHSFFELELVVSGSGTTRINNETFKINEGSIYIVRPSEIHQIYLNDDEQLTLWNFCFTAEHLSEKNRDKILCNPTENIFKLSSDDFKAAVKIIELINSFLDDRNYSDFCKKLTDTFLTLILRNVLIIEKNNNQDKAILTALKYIHSNIAENISLESISKKHGYSPNYFSKLFAEKVGINYKDYITKTRIYYACHLMRQNKLSPTAACYELGFQSYSSFLRAFHKVMGIPPKTYCEKME